MFSICWLYYYDFLANQKAKDEERGRRVHELKTLLKSLEGPGMDYDEKGLLGREYISQFPDVDLEADGIKTMVKESGTVFYECTQSFLTA